MPCWRLVIDDLPSIYRTGVSNHIVYCHVRNAGWVHAHNALKRDMRDIMAAAEVMFKQVGAAQRELGVHAGTLVTSVEVVHHNQQ